jgi:3-hydroxyisobutyrate dehydrogenase
VFCHYRWRKGSDSDHVTSAGLTPHLGLSKYPLRQSALYAPTFDKKLDRMLSRNFDNPNFPAKHLLKDMQLFLDAAEPSSLNLEVAQAICHLLETTARHSADQDYSVLYETLYPNATA